MFGRRKRDQEAAAEAERGAVLEQLAQRPENVCPFLGLASERAGYRDAPTGEHRCFAFGDPAPISDDQQQTVCLQRGYSNCPRYLRGVLVIPSEELEALRRPAPPPPPPTAPPPPEASSGGGGRRIWVPLLLVLLVVAAGGAWYVFANPFPPVAIVSPSPRPTPPITPIPAETPSSVVPSPASTPTPKLTTGPSVGPTPTPEPTPEPGDRFDHYEVGVGPTTYTLFTVNQATGIVSSETHAFSDFSRAPVVPFETNDGLVYWQTSEGGFTGLSYIPGQSGPFQLREVFLTATGERRVLVMTGAEETILPTATPSPFH